MRNSYLSLINPRKRLSVVPSSGEPRRVEPATSFSGSASGPVGAGPSPDPYQPLLDWLDEMVFDLEDTATRMRRLTERLRDSG